MIAGIELFMLAWFAVGMVVAVAVRMYFSAPLPVMFYLIYATLWPFFLVGMVFRMLTDWEI